ncbi:MAG: signal peptidase I [Lachnospiraceae bacterium]|uniref:signal peptidase I n=1 Tax=Candidatus Merdisoma sp. JLR.KK006 TaxID=3112626 RepID=UPI002FF205F2|nr:signal peptidase I [Lachnospiraceae bacterium]
MKKNSAVEVPDLSQLEKELNRVKYKKRYKSVLTSTISTLIVVAAIAVLIATLLMPVLQIYGTSMSPTLYDGDIIATIKTTEFEQGDVVAFYYNNKILVKRVIAMSGEWVDMDEDGNVYVNDVLLDEPYLVERAVGECDIKLPYQVPENRIFVMGDHRSVSVDSRSTTVGCVAEEQLVGRLLFRVWPLKDIGPVG